MGAGGCVLGNVLASQMVTAASRRNICSPAPSSELRPGLFPWPSALSCSFKGSLKAKPLFPPTLPATGSRYQPCWGEPHRLAPQLPSFCPLQCLPPLSQSYIKARDLRKPSREAPHRPPCPVVLRGDVWNIRGDIWECCSAWWGRTGQGCYRPWDGKNSPASCTALTCPLRSGRAALSTQGLETQLEGCAPEL